MIELLILACLVIVALVALLACQAHTHARSLDEMQARLHIERVDWQNERRFLVDRAIARHVGEILALEREDTRKQTGDVGQYEDRQPRPLLEGLS